MLENLKITDNSLKIIKKLDFFDFFQKVTALKQESFQDSKHLSAVARLIKSEVALARPHRIDPVCSCKIKTCFEVVPIRPY